MIEAGENLSESDIKHIEKAFTESIKPDYDKFVRSLRSALRRKIEKILILTLFGNERVFSSVTDAIAAIEKYDIIPEEGAKFYKFEVYIKFTNGDKIEGAFHEREEALKFLRVYKRRESTPRYRITGRIWLRVFHTPAEWVEAFDLRPLIESHVRICCIRLSDGAAPLQGARSTLSSHQPPTSFFNTQTFSAINVAFFSERKTKRTKKSPKSKKHGKARTQTI